MRACVDVARRSRCIMLTLYVLCVVPPAHSVRIRSALLYTGECSTVNNTILLIVEFSAQS